MQLHRYSVHKIVQVCRVMRFCTAYPTCHYGPVLRHHDSPARMQEGKIQAHFQSWHWLIAGALRLLSVHELGFVYPNCRSPKQVSVSELFGQASFSVKERSKHFQICLLLR